ncbi:hypothetical protein AB0P12_31955 [Streptomyces subrutilus]|uniref:Uncharacterized protein n=1 Tax=Streptomyces subrutilus TaxID=36818 RepID=A0A918RDF6_9ACTN|nr:hypothetical protein [Streptomyces subrutilus]WSJ31078.1 hypothetical protein OG479_18350 [Streptomyces subrutilus]GGZ95728.1 hypothetical protein GCM10010371_64660 [Streptomyces subrutilus]
MPIDPYAALNAMIRAEAARFTPPARKAEPVAKPKAAAPAADPESEPQRTTTADTAA